MPSRSRMLVALLLLSVVVLSIAVWQRDRLRLAWWDALASRGPDAETLGALEGCEEPGWTGWVTVAAADIAMPCGEPLAARQLSARLDPALRRAWLRGQLDRSDLSQRARWRITRALETSGASVPVATVTLLLDGAIDRALATEVLLADDGPRDPREVWLATTLRAARGEPLEALPWHDIPRVARLSGDRQSAVLALRAGLHVPADLEPRLHALPEAWAEALAPALACQVEDGSCLEVWVAAAEAWEESPEGEGLPRDDDVDALALDLGVLRPLLDYEGASDADRAAVSALLDAQAQALTLPEGRPWLGMGVGGQGPTLPSALWTGRMGPWAQALWVRELTRRSGGEGEVRRSERQLVATLGSSSRTLCGAGGEPGALKVVLDEELAARALLELHPEAIAAASRIARWTGPAHGLFGSTGDGTPPADPCGSSVPVSEG